jgi:hypothetical protein
MLAQDVTAYQVSAPPQAAVVFVESVLGPCFREAFVDGAVVGGATVGAGVLEGAASATADGVCVCVAAVAVRS